MMSKRAFQLGRGDVIGNGEIESIGYLAVWFGVLIKVTCEGRNNVAYFGPTEQVSLRCCNGASRDCPIHGDGN